MDNYLMIFKKKKEDYLEIKEFKQTVLKMQNNKNSLLFPINNHFIRTIH